MTIILRLQGLHAKAGTKDIRKFFDGLCVGGVYVVGGRLGEAFIAFATEKDAQLATRFSGGLLKGSRVTLHISNLAEMEHKLKSKIKRNEHSRLRRRTRKPRPPSPASPPPPPANPQPIQADVAAICEPIVPAAQSGKQIQNTEEVKTADYTNSHKTPLAVADDCSTHTEAAEVKPGYVKLFGLPAVSTKGDICHFFKGLPVQEVTMNAKLGLDNGCLVKFANLQDECDALLQNGQRLGSACIEVCRATESMWSSAVQECEDHSTRFGEANGVMSPSVRQNMRKPRSSHELMNPKGTMVRKRRGRSPAVQAELSTGNGCCSKLRKKPRYDDNSARDSSPDSSYCVMLTNVPDSITKKETKEFVGCQKACKALRLLDVEGRQTETAFVMFHRKDDYDYALSLNGCYLSSRPVCVTSITKEKMKEMLAESRTNYRKCFDSKQNKKKKAKKERSSKDMKLTAKTCIFIRNLPSNVQKTQIREVLRKNKLREDNIFILQDKGGIGLGEVLVQFESAKQAARAQRLHGLTFQGAQLLLTVISLKQLEDVLNSTQRGKKLYASRKCR